MTASPSLSITEATQARVSLNEGLDGVSTTDEISGGVLQTKSSSVCASQLLSIPSQTSVAPG